MSLWCKFAWLVFATKNTDEVNCWLSPVRICICRFLCVFKFVYFGFAKNSIRINPVERIMSSLSQFGIRQSNCVGLRCWAVEKMPMHLHQLHLRQIAKPTHHTILIAVPFFHGNFWCLIRVILTFIFISISFRDVVAWSVHFLLSHNKCTMHKKYMFFLSFAQINMQIQEVAQCRRKMLQHTASADWPMHKWIFYANVNCYDCNKWQQSFWFWTHMKRNFHFHTHVRNVHCTTKQISW